MFGGLALFLVNGNMSVAASQGGLLVRVSPDEADSWTDGNRITPMVMRGREMPGWLRVDTATVDADDDLELMGGPRRHLREFVAGQAEEVAALATHRPASPPHRGVRSRLESTTRLPRAMARRARSECHNGAGPPAPVGAAGNCGCSRPMWKGGHHERRYPCWAAVRGIDLHLHRSVIAGSTSRRSSLAGCGSTTTRRRWCAEVRKAGRGCAGRDRGDLRLVLGGRRAAGREVRGASGASAGVEGDAQTQAGQDRPARRLRAGEPAAARVAAGGLHRPAGAAGAARAGPAPPAAGQG